MIRRALLLVVLLLTACTLRIDVHQPRPEPRATTRYFSPAGSGTTCSSGSPCTVAYVLSQAACGDTLIAKDGVYTTLLSGASPLLITPATTSALNCIGNPVTLRAENPGGPIFDGQHSSTTTGVYIYRVKGWTIQDINARYAGNCPFVVGANGDATSATTDIIVQRVVAWDSDQDVNCHVLLVEGASNILIEDSAFFGLAEETVMDGGSNTVANVTYRRVFIRTEGSPRTGCGGTGNPCPSVANQWNYTTENHPTPSLIENVIITNGPPRKGRIQYLDNTMRHDANTTISRQLGNIVYAGAGTTSDGNFLMHDGGGPACSGYLIQDTIVHHNGTNQAPISNPSFDSAGCDPLGPTNNTRQYTRVTAIRGTNASSLSSATTTNFIEDTSVAGTQFNYIGANNTARLCYQYQNGIYQDGTGGTTAKPLWPWPMDERIKAAIGLNTTGNGAIGGSSPALGGSAGSGYTANTVTSEIVSIFGAIPSQCTSVGGPFVPPFPQVSDFPSIPCCLDDFTRANGPIGANYTWAAGPGFTVSSNQAVAPAATATRGWYSAGSYSALHEVYADWPAIPVVDTVLLTFGGGNLTDTGYHLILTRSGGTASLRVARIPGGYTEIWGPVNLTTDVSNGQSFGIRVGAGQTIYVYWKFTDGLWYRIGSVVDTNLPTSGVRIGFGSNDSATLDNFGGGSPAAVGPPSVGRFGSLFPKQ